MRKLNPNKLKLIFTAFFSIIIIPVLLALFARTVLLHITQLSYFFPCFALLLLLTPAAKILLAESIDQKPIYSFSRWLLLIITAEIVLALLFFSFLYPLIHYIPHLEYLNKYMTPQSIAYQFTFFWGFYPWAMIATLSAALGYICFHEKKPPLFSSLIPEIPHTHYSLVSKRIFHILLGAITSYVIILTISFGAIQLSLLISNLFHLSITYGVNFTTMLLALVMLSLESKKTWNQAIQFLCRIKIPVGLFLLGMMLIIGALLIFANLFNPFLNTIVSSVNVPTIEINPNLSSKRFFDLLIWGWCIGWTPLITSFIANISYGRSIRSVILGVLIFPLLITILGIIFSNSFVAIIHRISEWKILLEILALSGPIFIIFLFRKEQDSRYMVLGFLPRDDTHNITKPRLMIKFIKPFLQTISMLSFIYIFLGYSLISFVSTWGMVPCLILFIGMGLIFYWRILKK